MGLLCQFSKVWGKEGARFWDLYGTPEFLREEKGIYDFMNPTRIVIGEYDKRSGDTLSSLYQGITVRILRVSLKTAESAASWLIEVVSC
ncbi:hypothetical protein ACFLTY_05525 [Chloroflexota bacterium]